MFNEGRISFMFIFIIISKKINASLNFLVLGLCPVKWDIFTMAIKQAIPLQGTKELRNRGHLVLINKDKRVQMIFNGNCQNTKLPIRAGHWSNLFT